MRITLLKIDVLFYWLFFFCWFFQFVEENPKSVKLSRGYGAQKFFDSCTVTRFLDVFEGKIVKKIKSRRSEVTISNAISLKWEAMEKIEYD